MTITYFLDSLLLQNLQLKEKYQLYGKMTLPLVVCPCIVYVYA